MSACPPLPAYFPPDYPASLFQTPVVPHHPGPVLALTYPAERHYSQPPCPCKCEARFHRFSQYILEARHNKNGWDGFLGDKCFLKKTLRWSGDIHYYTYDKDGLLMEHIHYSGSFIGNYQWDVYGNLTYNTVSTITYNRWYYSTQTHFNQPYHTIPYHTNRLVSTTNTLRIQEADCPTSPPPPAPFGFFIWGDATIQEELSDEYTDNMLMSVLEELFATLPTPPPVPKYHYGARIIARISAAPNSASYIPLLTSFIATATADVAAATAAHTAALSAYNTNPNDATWQDVEYAATQLRMHQESLNTFQEELDFHSWWQANVEHNNPLVNGNRVQFSFQGLSPAEVEAAQSERLLTPGVYPSGTSGRLSRVFYRCVLQGLWRAWSAATGGSASATWQHSIATGPPFSVTSDSGPFTEQAPGELQPTGSQNTWVFLPQYELPPPDSGHRHKRIVVAPPADIPLQPTYIDLRGGWMYKTGFPEYDAPSWPPKVYAREVFSGGFSGCPALALPPKDYSGQHGYNKADAAYDYGVPADVAAAPGWRYTDLFNYRRFSDPGQILSPTKRKWLSHVQCAPSPAPPLNDLLLAELQDEFTTGQLTAFVNTAANLDDNIFLPYPYDANSQYALTHGWGHCLSDDERFYLRIHARIQFYFSLRLQRQLAVGLSPYYEELLSPIPEDDFAGCTLAWDEVSRSWPSGTITSASHSLIINGWWNNLPHALRREPAAGAFTAWITNARVLADPRLIQLPQVAVVAHP